MAKTILADYLHQHDCLLSGGRAHNLQYGLDSRNYVIFRNARFGLRKGPKLDEIAKSFIVQEQTSIRSRIEHSMQSKHTNSSSEQNIIPEERLKGVAYELISCCSFANALEPAILRKIDPSHEDIVRSVETIYQKIRTDSFNSLQPQTPLLLVNSLCYVLHEGLRGGDNIVAEINGKVLASNCSETIPVNSIEEEYEARLEQRIETEVKKETASTQAPPKSKHVNYNKKQHSTEYHCKKHNLGFIEIDIQDDKKEMWIFTWTPEYILKEHISGTYFKFPPAQIGVQLVRKPSGDIVVEKPYVMNRYKHPALPRINKNMQKICFQFHNRPDYAELSTVDTALLMLRDGVKMMMTSYGPEGKAHKNLDRPKFKKQFEDIIVRHDEVDESLVTNYECINRSRGL